MKVLVTGGTGFIGSPLVKKLVVRGHEVTVLSRHPEKVETICGPGVKAIDNLKLVNADDIYHAVVNLAGEPIFDALWSDERKKIIRDSRIGLTEELVECIARMTVKPEVLISGSACGYYGDQGDTVVTEQTPPNADFSQQLCADWEATARKAETAGVRVCLIRTGLVIAAGGGLLKRMLLPFRLGLGGRLGSGKQWMSWIHREDWIAIAETMLADPAMRGAYNASAPNPVTNREFTETLARTLHRPALMSMPAWLLKTALGEMSQLLLASQRVVPERLLEHGFKFKYPDLASALNQAIEQTNE